MRYIRDIHLEKEAAGKPVVSFEFFPPKTEKGEENLLKNTLPQLMEAKPDYCSVTYGAGGGTREKTLGIVDAIQQQHQLPAMSHLTCVNATRDEIGGVLQEAKDRGIQNILALRGDPPGGDGDFEKTEGGFEYSCELIEYIRSWDCFSIGAAGFPEGHIACKEGKQADWKHLKGKVDSGAEFILTQLFFDNADYFEFRDYVTGEMGVNVPICPGIIPIMSAGQIKRFTALCGSKLPDALLESLEKIGDDNEAATAFGIDYATRQCRELLDAGVPGLHFYTLNKSHSTLAILKNLNLV